MDTMEMLMKAGFSQGQARAIVGAACDAQKELATKIALRRLETNLRREIKNVGLELCVEMQKQFSQLYWRLIVGASIISTAMIGIFGLMITYIQ